VVTVRKSTGLLDNTNLNAPSLQTLPSTTLSRHSGEGLIHSLRDVMRINFNTVCDPKQPLSPPTPGPDSLATLATLLRKTQHVQLPFCFGYDVVLLHLLEVGRQTSPASNTVKEGALCVLKASIAGRWVGGDGEQERNSLLSHPEYRALIVLAIYLPSSLRSCVLMICDDDPLCNTFLQIDVFYETKG